MARAISNIEKQRGRPATGATPIMVRVLPDQLKAIDDWIEQDGGRFSRPEAIRQLVAIGLRGR